MFQRDGGVPMIHSAYESSVSECRRILQSISNIVFADTSQPPNISRLPMLISALKQKKAPKTNFNVKAAASKDKPYTS